MSKESKQTDLGKAHQMAVPLNDFSKLVEGDLKSSINFLVYLDNHPEVKEEIVKVMYQDYLKMMSQKMNGEEVINE